MSWSVRYNDITIIQLGKRIIATMQTSELIPLKVDHSSPLPLYRQLREVLLALLKEREFQEGDPFPTERELELTYQVSRITVRRALDELIREGYLVARQGKGTFVAKPKINRHVPQMRSFSQEMAEQGRLPGSRLLSLGHQRVGRRISNALSLPEDSWVWVVERLRLADEEPICISLVYLNLPPQITLTPVELEQEPSLWKIMEAKGIHFAYREESIQAIAAGAREAELLLIEPGVPLLFVEGIVYSDRGDPIEYHQMQNRGDRYIYTVQTVSD
jgi:GntR family transcriptional regulator